MVLVTFTIRLSSSSFREVNAARLSGRGCGGGPCGLWSRMGGSSRFLSFGLWLIAITIHIAR